MADHSTSLPVLRRSAPVLALAASLVLLAGCGGDDAETATGSAASTSTSAAPAPSEGASPSSSGGGEGSEYVDPDGFAITYPDEWQTRKDVAGLQVVGSADASFKDNVGVILEDTGQPSLTVEQYLEASVTNAPKLIQQFRLVDRDDTTGTLEYTGTVQQRDAHFLARAVVEDGKAYTATYTASPESYEEGLEAAKAVLESLRAS